VGERGRENVYMEEGESGESMKDRTGEIKGERECIQERELAREIKRNKEK
jgi:hypothetical protein